MFSLALRKQKPNENTSQQQNQRGTKLERRRTRRTQKIIEVTLWEKAKENSPKYNLGERRKTLLKSLCSRNHLHQRRVENTSVSGRRRSRRSRWGDRHRRSCQVWQLKPRPEAGSIVCVHTPRSEKGVGSVPLKDALNPGAPHWDPEVLDTKDLRSLDALVVDRRGSHADSPKKLLLQRRPPTQRQEAFRAQNLPEGEARVSPC